MYNLCMIVYRIVKKPELENLVAGDTENLGNYFSRVKHRNTHKYKEGQKYLHFFKRKSAYKNYLHSLGHKPDDDYHLVTLNIPFKELILHTAKGYYFPVGYDVNYIVEREYALPAQNFDPTWITSHELIFKYESKKEDCLDK